MPYVDEHARERHAHDDTQSEIIAGPGELCYLLQQTVQRYLLHNLPLRFQSIADVTAAIQQLQRDFDERIVAPYEAIKAAENGDVWDTRLWNR